MRSKQAKWWLVCTPAIQPFTVRSRNRWTVCAQQGSKKISFVSSLPKEKLALLAAHQATMCIFLSVQAIDQVMATLKEGGYPGDTPVAIVARATWPDQRIFRGTIDTIADILHQAGVVRQAMIVVGKVLDTDYELSKLYDSKFTTMFRKGTDGE